MRDSTPQMAFLFFAREAFTFDPCTMIAPEFRPVLLRDLNARAVH